MPTEAKAVQSCWRLWVVYIRGAKIEVSENNADNLLRRNYDFYGQCYDEDGPVGRFISRSLARYQSHQAGSLPRHIAQEPQYKCNMATLVE